MTDELTTKMHSEFDISKETEIKHKCYMALLDIKEFNYSIEYVCELYNISKEEIEQHKSEFLNIV